uniref:Phosphoenolpyruvate carboxylase n=1 Tax=Rhizophora mucronata TaxID=61149 RepID=A0A2P2JIP8_RHIMU
MPPLGFLFDGRLPMFIRPYSNSGVAQRKYSTKRGSWKTMERYSFVATIAISSMSARHSGFGETGGCIPCSSVAAVKRCSVLKHKCSSPKDCSITSP